MSCSRGHFTGTVNVWRANADGSNPKQLTGGPSSRFPTCTPDGKWVYYVPLGWNLPALMRMPTEGGPAELVPGAGMRSVSLSAGEFSHDGRVLVFRTEIIGQANQSTENKLLLLDTSAASAGTIHWYYSLVLFNGSLICPPQAHGPVHFVPGEKAVAYPIRDKDVDNIWVQPLDGSAGHQITDFSTGHINDFHRSPDGKLLAVLHVQYSADVVPLRDSKP